MTLRDRPKRLVATNRKARHDYAISHVVEAGLVLLGSEVKSLRGSAASLQDGYARLESGELFLYGVHVPPLPQASYFNHEPRRPRKPPQHDTHQQRAKNTNHTCEHRSLGAV